MTKKLPTFEDALRDLPSDVDYDPLAMKLVEEVRSSAGNMTHEPAQPA